MAIITITNMDTKEFFFSTEHCQPCPDNFVPVSHYGKKYPISYREVRDFELSMGNKEILNPDYNYIPLYILEEVTKPDEVQKSH